MEVVGGPPLAYQWFFENDAIVWATNSSLTLTNVQPEQAGAYVVVITNVYGAVTSAPAMLQFYPTVVLTNSDEMSLRAAMAQGGTVIFACDGTITLFNTITNEYESVLDASGHQITISGSDSARVFYVATNVSFSIIHLTIADGRSTNGAGILNDGGTVNATNCVFFGNGAFGVSSPIGLRSPQTGGNGYGGAIYNVGILNADYCSFLQNVANGGAGTTYDNTPANPPDRGLSGGLGGTGVGGAIYNVGAMTITRSVFASNTASGGMGGLGSSRWQRQQWHCI